MCEWSDQSVATLIASLIGVFGALMGVIITIKYENRRRRKERIEENTPIIINYQMPFLNNAFPITDYYFDSHGECSNDIVGIFKNTDSGIMFIDCVKTEKKIYYPRYNSTVDKSTVFRIVLHNIAGETFKTIKIFLHDIYGNKYYYSGSFVTNTKSKCNFIIDSQPIRDKNK